MNERVNKGLKNIFGLVIIKSILAIPSLIFNVVRKRIAFISISKQETI